MSEVRSHRDLKVWQKSMDMTVAVYELTRFFPKDELYRITSQVTRSAASVPANIAEGHARGTRKDYAHFLAVSKGSLMETETFLLLAIRLNYISQNQAQLTLDLITEISKMLTKLRQTLTE
jgi:four helix bundle protein